MVQLLKKAKSKRSVMLAAALFVLQFVYYQFQGYMDRPLFELIPAGLVALSHVNDPLKLASVFHIFVHSAFSIIIVHFLYQNRQSTLFVVYMSVILIALFAFLYIMRIFLPSDIIRIAASNLLLFLATPFKTIFSIPSLQLQLKNTSI